jgi:hypothetical protein
VRRPLILSFLIPLLAGIGLFSISCSGGDNPPPSPPPSSAPRSSPRESPQPPSPTAVASVTRSPSPSVSPRSWTLTYLRGTRIVTRALGSNAEHVEVDLHTAGVAASGSGWLAYVVPKRGSASGEDGDFVRRPELHLLELDSGEDLKIGLGFAPLWKADGTEVAFLRPNRARRCDGESCAGKVHVLVVAPGEPAGSISGSGQLHLLAWAGDRVLVSDDRHLTSTTSLSAAGGSPFSIPVPPSEIWDASPDGSLLLSVAPGKLKFTELRGGHLTEKVRSVPIPGAILGDGSWSAGSGKLVGVLRMRDGRSSLSFLSPDRPPLPVPGSSGAMGNVVWDRAGDSFAYVGVDATRRSRLQAILCRPRPAGREVCRRWFSWAQGVSLLELRAP